MAKRTTFYVTTALFEMDISFKAKLVLTYLSRTSNKEGTCYPSIASIARCCGCCKNTVRKALRELESAGIVSVTPSYAESKNGKRRRQANIYTLRIPGSPDAPAPVQTVLEGGAANGAEVNNDSNTIIAVPSIGTTGDDGNDLERILAELHLDTFYDQGFAKSIDQAIRTMYEYRSGHPHHVPGGRDHGEETADPPGRCPGQAPDADHRPHRLHRGSAGKPLRSRHLRGELSYLLPLQRAHGLHGERPPGALIQRVRGE